MVSPLRTVPIISVPTKIALRVRGQTSLHVLTPAGKDFVEWLVSHGYAVTRTEALEIGKLLLEHDILHHFKDEYHFEDQDYFYRFRVRSHITTLLTTRNMSRTMENNVQPSCDTMRNVLVTLPKRARSSGTTAILS